MKPHSVVKNSANKKASKCKVVKSLTPLINFKFYLDIEKHNVSLKIESRIKELGGSIEFFLTKDVTHFVTDKVLDRDNSLESPQPPPSPIPARRTPLSNYSETGSNASISNDSKAGGNKIKSRADAMLQRARQNQTNPIESERSSTQINRSPTQVAKKWGIRIWHTDYTIKYLEKVYNAIKERYNGEFPPKSKDKIGNARILKGNYVKIESFEKHFRPYYHELKGRWPVIDLQTVNSSNAFIYTNEHATGTEETVKPSVQKQQQPRTNLAESKQSQDVSRMTRKNRSKHIRVQQQPTSRLSSDKQCGFCEMCRVEYDVLTTHLKSDEHQNFVRADGNFINLDTLIKSSANVDKFLSINKPLFNGNDCDILPKRSKRNIAAATQRMLQNNSFSDVEPMNEKIEMSRRSFSETNSLLRNTRNSISRQSTYLLPAVPLRPPPPPVVKTNLPETEKHGIGAAVRSRRESIRKINYAEPGEDEEIIDEAIFQVQRKRKVPTKMAPPPPPPPPQSANNRLAKIKIEEPEIKPKLPISVVYKVVNTKMESSSTNKKHQPATAAGSNSEQSASGGGGGPLIVKFRKVRQTELAILNGEAVNFMFPPKMSSDISTDNDRQTSSQPRTYQSSDLFSSDINSSPKRKPTLPNQADESTTTDSSSKRRKLNNLRNSLVADEPTEKESHVAQVPSPSLPQSSHRRPRKNGQRQRNRRFQWTPIQPSGRRKLEQQKSINNNCEIVVAAKTDSPPEDGMGEKEESCDLDDILKNDLRKYKFSFERIPFREPWYSAYTRQDECKERSFEYFGSTSYRKLPYETGPFPWLPDNCGCTLQTTTTEICSNQASSSKLNKTVDVAVATMATTATIPVESTSKQLKSSLKEKHENPKKKKECIQKTVNPAAAKLLNMEMPRKSPREHPSTLAILSCLLNRRDREDRLLTSPRRKSDPGQQTEKSSELVCNISPITARSSPTKPPETTIALPVSPQIGESVKRLRRGEKLLENKKLIKIEPIDQQLPKPLKCPPRRGPGRPRSSGGVVNRRIHWKQRPLEMSADRKTPLSSKEENFVNVNQLSNQIDLYLSQPLSDLDFRETELPAIATKRKTDVIDDFRFEPNLNDLVLSDSQFKNVAAQNAINNQTNRTVANKLRLYKIFSINKKVKVNRTGWPKKRRVVTRQQKDGGNCKTLNGMISVDLSRTLQTKGGTTEMSLSTQSPITPPETDTEEKADCDPSSTIVLRDENTNLTFGSDRADNSDMFTVSSDNSLDTVLDVGSQIKSEIQKEILANRKCKVNLLNKLPIVKVRKSCRQHFRKVTSPLALRQHNIKVEKVDVVEEMINSFSRASPTPPSSSSADQPGPPVQSKVEQLQHVTTTTAATSCSISPRRLRKPRGRWYRER